MRDWFIVDVRIEERDIPLVKRFNHLVVGTSLTERASKKEESIVYADFTETHEQW